MEIEVGSVWKASDGRLLRVVCVEPRRIGVRNHATNRLSYMQRRYFERANAGIGWWLEPYTAPLLAGGDGLESCGHYISELPCVRPKGHTGNCSGYCVDEDL